MAMFIHAMAATLTLLAPGREAAEVPTASEVVQNVRRALGHGAISSLPAVTCRGRSEDYGVESEYRLDFDGRGRFRVAKGGPLAEERGFDGETCWTKDWSKATRALEVTDRDENLGIFWVQGGHWLGSQSPFDAEVLAEESDDREVVLSLRQKQGAFGGKLRIDRETWRPRRFEAALRDGPQSWDFSDYREFQGGWIAHKVVHEAEGKVRTTAIREVSVGNEPDDRFRFAPQGPDNVKFDPEAPARLEVRRVRTGHILVHPLVNGQDVGWFIFDSGAGLMTIDKKAAAQLDLPVVGSVRATGVGGSTEASFRQDETFRLGPLTLEKNLYVELDLGTLSKIMGQPIAGIVGYQVFQAAVVEIECAGPEVALHDPATYRRDGDVWEELVLYSNHPCCHAVFEGDRRGLFRLDTGATNTVSFHAPAVDSLKLLDGRKTGLGLEGGVGGLAAYRGGTLEWFELGGHRFEKPRVTFSRVKKGAFTDTATLGNIGQAFLEPFRVVFWYQQKKIAFLPRGE
jgi:hypothetical protein